MDKYKLDLGKISEEPEGARAKVSAGKRHSVVDATKRYSAHQEMKKNIPQKVRKNTENKKPKHLPKFNDVLVLH